MKRIITFSILLLLAINLFSQAPNKMNYQAVLRDASGGIKANTNVNLGISIIQGSATGTVVYIESHALTTNELGLVTAEIGSKNETAFGNIDWSNGPYYVEISVDGTKLGTSQLLSVPYAFYSNKAEYAETSDFTNLVNAPDFSLWDQDVTDDFDGQYSSLVGAPEEYWTQNGSDLYYSLGKVGINVTSPADFGGAILHVGGAIKYDGLPSAYTPGMLYYDPSGDGEFKYVDNTNTSITLGTGDITYTGTYEANVSGDIVRPNDYIISGSMEIGMDGVNGYNFGFNTLVFAENNLRILFDDTDTEAGYPNNDWQIEINESANGGTNHFAINDVTFGTTPFKIMAGAPNNSLFVASDGKVGVGTSTPSNELTVDGSVKAASFIGDGSAITGITGATGGLSNTGDAVIGADTDANNSGEIALQTKGVTRLLVTNNGNVGIGTATPSASLEVVGGASFQNAEVNGTLTTSAFVNGYNKETISAATTLDYNVNNRNMVGINATVAGVVIDGFTAGEAGQQVTIINESQPVTINHNGGGTQKILFPGGANIVLNSYGSATFIYDGTSWYCIGLNN